MRRQCFSGLAAVLACVACAGASAGEFRAAMGDWRYDLAGAVSDQGRTYDFQDDLELQTSGRRSVLLEWDTGPGGWPDWSASYARLGASGDHEETFTLFVGGIPVGSQTESITTTADFDDFDLTARYPFELGALRCAAGVTAKRVRGEILLDDSSRPAPSRQQYDEIVPQLHAQVRWPLGKNFALAASGQGVEYDGSRAMEWRASAEIRWLAPLLLEAGWQEKNYDLDLGGYAFDAKLDGALLRAGFLLR